MEKISNSTQVGQEKERIDGISGRLEIAKVHNTLGQHQLMDALQNKVQRIAGSTKAIKVHSSAKYPAPAQLESYHPLYVDVEAKPPRHTRYHLTDVPHVSGSTKAPTRTLTSFPAASWQCT